MEEAQRLLSLLSEYGEYATQVLQPEVTRIEAILAPWMEPSFWRTTMNGAHRVMPTPIRSIFSRIKRPEQVINKILRKPDEYPDGLCFSSIRAMHDTIGIRIISFFLSHLPHIDRELRHNPLLELSGEKPPEAWWPRDMLQRFGLGHIQQKEKESGYTSLHYVCRLRQGPGDEGPGPWFEIQVRTMAQELWSEMEHLLGYKPGKRSSHFLRRRLQILSTQLQVTDEHFHLLYEELLREQDQNQPDSEDVLRAENLPAVLEEVGVPAAQRDLYAILQLLESRGIQKVSELIALITPRRLETIQNTYIALLGHEPGPLDVLAGCAALSTASREHENLRLSAQIEYNRTWQKIQQVRQRPSAQEGGAPTAGASGASHRSAPLGTPLQEPQPGESVAAPAMTAPDGL